MLRVTALIVKSVLAALAVAACLVGHASAAPSGPQVHVASGTLQGVRRGAADAFLGVPFAAPPIGAARWTAPRPARPWRGVRQATHFAASCWQAVSPAGFGPWTHEYVVGGPVSEDCLYLNVWTPAHRSARPAPVLVWIHGGAFTSGSGSVPVYDGAALAERGVVVVTINYRLGVFGFFAYPELTKEAKGDPPANFGLQDMVAALSWVRTNIAAFGGDPNAVTVDGQSAGAMAIHDLLESPKARGLFARAIIESGLPSVAPPAPLAQAEAAGAALAKAKGAENLHDLRMMPAEKLASGPPSGPAAPVRDGVFLPGSPGPTADLPVLIGVNADESSAMSPRYGSSKASDLEALLGESYGDMASLFAAFYPAAGDEDRASASREVLRDRTLAALYAWSRGRLAQSRSPLYAYVFTHPEPGPQATRYKAFHSAEIPYAFRTLGASPERNFTPADRALSDVVSGYWLNFIRNGDPNGGALPHWPRLTISNPEIMELGDTLQPRPFLPEDRLKAVDAFLDKGGSPRMF
jgi:para-nitrobenzyl esterase